MISYPFIVINHRGVSYHRNNKDIHLSKSLSWLLRHGAVQEGLKLSPEGYLEVNNILQHKTFRGKYNTSDIERVVTNNDKQRFKLRHNPQTNVLEIKANQGHTISQVTDSDLLPILETKYNTVIHSTYLKNWPKIKYEGLSRMKRKHVHLSKGPFDDTIASGLRKDAEVHIYIDLARALADGLKFYESENGVILTSGNSREYIESKYFAKVVNINTGYPKYTQAQDLIHAFSKIGQVKVEKISYQLAVLRFSTNAEAKAAMELNKRMAIYGAFLTVKSYTGKDRAVDEEFNSPQSPKMDFPMSKQKAVIIEPQHLDLSGDFYMQLDNIMAAVRLTQEAVMGLSQLYMDLERVLQSEWPGCTAIPFGSITTGLGVKTSDADCFINVPLQSRLPNANYVIRTKRLLQMYPNTFAEILSIPRANTPIVKFFHIPTETNCDVSFKTPLGVQNSKLIAFMLHVDPRLIPISIAIKYWAKIHDLSGTGKLTNYTLILLIIFYLQQPPMSILPSVESLQRDRTKDWVVDFWNTGFTEQTHLPSYTNTSSISVLLGGFFEYYSVFNFEEMVVCPYLGFPIKKVTFKDPNQLPNEFERYKINVLNNLVLPLRHTAPICVQDPFEQCHNVATTINNRLASDIKTFFKFAANVYENEKLNNCQDFLKTILLKKPKLIRNKTHPEYRLNIYPRTVCNIINPDWKKIVKKCVMTVFEVMLKIKLGKIEEKVNPDSKKEREKYICTMTKAIWKRKQFSKLYSAMEMNFVEKQTKITEEIITADKQLMALQYHVMLTFSHNPRSAAINVKMIRGDLNEFKEFGKFFMSVMQDWILQLLEQHSRPNTKDTAKKIAETIDVLDNLEIVTDNDDDDTSNVNLSNSVENKKNENKACISLNNSDDVSPCHGASATNDTSSQEGVL